MDIIIEIQIYCLEYFTENIRTFSFLRSISFVDVEHTHVRFLGNLVLNLWDCGGQYRFYESYFDSQRDTIFRNVEVLIYVFDIETGDLGNDITLFDGAS